MSPEWLSAIVAIIAAFVAGGAAIISFSQAISARRQADSSELSAKAALEQVEIAKEALATAKAQHASAVSDKAGARIAFVGELTEKIEGCFQAAIDLQLRMAGPFASNADPTKINELVDCGNQIGVAAHQLDEDAMLACRAFVADLRSLAGNPILFRHGVDPVAKLGAAKRRAVAFLDAEIARLRDNSAR